MGANAPAHTAPASASASGSRSNATGTRSLLRWGIIVGPFYLGLGLIQALVRDGFDLARHPLSLLANGTGGWVQTANFVVSGAMVIAAAVGFARVLRPQSRAAGWILGIHGAGMLAAAVFRADPVDGFPPGTPEGFPTAVSTAGLLHFIAGGITFLALAISCFVVARALSRRNDSWMARLSFLSGVAVAAGFFGPFFLPIPTGPTAAIWFAVVVGWTWLALTSLHLYRGVENG